MKKFLKTTLVVSLILATLLMVVSCGKKEGIVAEIGATKPTATPTVAVDESMTAIQLLEASVTNYYGADYVASVLSGAVDTELLGIKVVQAVLGRKIRQGKYSENFANDTSNYFIDNKSYSAFAAVYEETLIKAGDIRYRTVSNAKSAIKQNRVDMYDMQLNQDKAKWKDIEEYGDDMAAYVTAKASDPRKIWAYLINADTIASTTEVVHDSKNGTYTFDVTMDHVKATAEYLEVMKYQLVSNSGMEVDDLEFTKLVFKVVIWDNGFLANLGITESYKMVMNVPVLGGINSVITLNSVQSITYDPNEDGYQFSNFENQF